MTERFILVCSCFNMSKKASEAFSVMFPNDVLPQIIKGRDRIYKFSLEKDSHHIKAISRLSGRFAYYIHIEDGKIVEEWDLLKGKRIA